MRILKGGWKKKNRIEKIAAAVTTTKMSLIWTIILIALLKHVFVYYKQLFVEQSTYIRLLGQLLCFEYKKTTFPCPGARHLPTPGPFPSF